MKVDDEDDSDAEIKNGAAAAEEVEEACLLEACFSNF